jgi:hypothetical protein
MSHRSSKYNKFNYAFTACEESAQNRKKHVSSQGNFIKHLAKQIPSLLKPA